MATKKHSRVGRKEREADQLLSDIRKIRAEKDGFLPDNLIDVVERDLTGSGDLAVARRAAFAYLSTPYHETEDKIRKDRDLAVAMANVADVLQGAVVSYKQLVTWLEVAQGRILLALSVRNDMTEVIAEGKRASESAGLEKEARHG